MAESPLKRAVSADVKSKRPKFFPSSIVNNQLYALVGLGIITGVSAVLIALHGPSLTQSGKPVDIVIPPAPDIPEDIQMQQGVPFLEKAEDPEKKSQSLFNSKTLEASKDKISNLIAWMMSHGIAFSNSVIVTYDAINDHRGIHSTRDFDIGDIVFTIPEEVMVTSETGRTSSIGKLLRERVETDAHFVYLSFFLLEERALGRKSSWYPFIETLPVSFLNMPVNFGEEEIGLLEGSLAKHMYEQELGHLHTTYNMIRERIPELTDKFTFEDYKWGYLSVLTRTFFLTVHGKTVYAMMPYADMFNHELENNILWAYNDDINSATFTATKPISQGTALSVSYGDKGNEALLMYYGFALRDNPNNEAAIFVGLIPTDPLIDRKIPLMRNSVENLYRQLFVLSASPDHLAFREVLKLCRLAVATEDELQFLPKSGDHLPISLDNERNALLLLSSKADTALSKFSQTMQNDEKLLENKNLSVNHRNIILTRLGEKQVLQKIIGFVNLAVSLLQVENEKVFKKARLQPQYREFRSYLREVAEVYRRRSRTN